MRKVERKQSPVDRTASSYNGLIRTNTRSRNNAEELGSQRSAPVGIAHTEPLVAHLMVMDARIIGLGRQR